MTTVDALARVLFWIGLSGILYTYFIYPALLFSFYVITQVCRDLRFLLGWHNRRALPLAPAEAPGVTLVIPAHNEEEHLAEKIANLERIEYPRDKIQIVFVSDGSSDRTNSLLHAISDPRIEAIFLPERQGKASALNLAVDRARHQILVFSDASTLLAEDALTKLVRHFRNPDVGGVCGALRFFATAESQQTEGVYWRYESVLRLMEARLGSTLTASGALYALRRDAYVPLAADTVLDDFVAVMNARSMGFSIVYDPEAVGFDFAPSNIAGEFTRRVRLARGSFGSLGFFLRVRLPWFTRFAFVSHKLLRWLVAPMLLMVLGSNLMLVSNHHPWYIGVAVVQLGLYAWAAIGFLFRERLRGMRFAQLGYFLLAMNLAFLVGLFRSLSRSPQTAWQRVN